MKRWLVGLAAAVAVLMVVPGSARGQVLEEPGTECGSTASVTPAAAGVLDPNTAHWYEASFDSGTQTLHFQTTGFAGGPAGSIFIYDWDEETNTCSFEAAYFCSALNQFSDCFPPNGGISHIFEEPGSYQVSVRNSVFFAQPAPIAYLIAEEPQP